MKILFLGNSITLHGAAPQLGWYGNWGMAATCEENDYVHRLCAMLRDAGKEPIIRVRNVADLERTPAALPEDYFAEDLAFDPDIVVIRICENTPAEQAEAFGVAYESLVRTLRQRPHCEVFAVGAFWKNDGVDALMRGAAERAGGRFVSLDAVHEDVQAYTAVGQFEHPGVAAHPSDAGMEVIAEAIFAEIRKAGLLDGAHMTPLPEGEPCFGLYSVRVDGQDAPLYQVRVSAMPFNRTWPGYQRDINQSELAAMLTLDMTAPLDVTVVTRAPVKTAVVRPLSAHVETTVEGTEIRFTLRKPGQYSLEMDGRHQNLHIFANPPLDPQWNDQTYTYYFKAGRHDVGPLILHSNESVYLEPGAVVFGAIQAWDAENIKIVGRGIIDYSRIDRPQTDEPFAYEYNGLMNLVRCRNVTIDGVILRDTSWWTITSTNCSNLYFHNVKSVGMWRYNADGFDFVCCQNVHVDGCFLRQFDDVLVFKGYNVQEFGIYPTSPEGKVSPPYNLQNNENILVENCVLWCDWGGTLEIGAETATDEYVNLTFRNCDIIHSSDGAIRFHCGDRALVHQALYDDIRIEYDGYERVQEYQHTDETVYSYSDAYYTSPVVVGVMYCNVFSKAGLLGNVRDVILRNISVVTADGLPCPPVAIRGADAEHCFRRIRIEHFRWNGQAVEPPLLLNEFAEVEVEP